ncbi:MAG TPA: hypothetical protein DDY21_00160 [Candidatus Moranbacteria bacterium]|nr:hypothetical protein [Candidatus Moranbacteria bacterium]
MEKIIKKYGYITTKREAYHDEVEAVAWSDTSSTEGDPLILIDIIRETETEYITHVLGRGERVIIFSKSFFSKNKELKEGKVVCEECGKIYDYYTEPAEVQQGGTHICAECWAEEE